MFSPTLDALLQALRCLPGVGPKTAQRMALHLLERNRDGAEHLAQTLQQALACVSHCQRCRNLTEEQPCRICRDEKRDGGLLCIVESPMDVLAVEQSGSYRGRYFVLMGHLSPIDGIGPDRLGIPELLHQVQQGQYREIILATNPTVEGEATTHYLYDQLRAIGVQAVTRLAQGVPAGGELEYLDAHTLSQAFRSRHRVE